MPDIESSLHYAELRSRIGDPDPSSQLQMRLRSLPHVEAFRRIGTSPKKSQLDLYSSLVMSWPGAKIDLAVDLINSLESAKNRTRLLKQLIQYRLAHDPDRAVEMARMHAPNDNDVMSAAMTHYVRSNSPQAFDRVLHH